MVKALVWGTREPGFKSRRPDCSSIPIAGQAGETVLAGRTVQRASRWRAWLRRAAVLAGALAASLLVLFGAIMVVTPSVGNANSLARAQALAHHAPFPGPAVPARFAAALISTEDHRFASEPGFDPLALGRIVQSVLTGRDQGGATLYQQLAKLLYAQDLMGIKLYVDELALGIKLKFSYSSAQILRMYADVAYFGHGYYGLQKASCGYFGRPPDRLSWPQSAVLAGLVQAPSAYDPLSHPALARSREGHVLARLVATGMLTRRQAAKALAVPMDRLLAAAGGCR